MVHKRRRETFAELIGDLPAADPAPAGEAQPYPSPLHDGGYLDEQGVWWRLRRGELRWSRLQHLVLDPGVRLLHLYLAEVTEIADSADRDAFLSRIRPYLKGDDHVPEPGDYTDFAAGEFKDEQHRSLLIVEEHC